MTYVIRDKLSKLYKIGKCKNFKTRFSTLNTSNLNLELVFLLHYIPEKDLHKSFKSKRISKEWFDLTQEDLLGIIELEEEFLKISL